MRAVVLDIGGVLQLGIDGREPALAFRELIATWEARLAGDGALSNYLLQGAPGGLIGAFDEAAWLDGLRGLGLDGPELDAFLAGFWDVYLGEPNTRLTDWLRAQRPQQRTALLSNSFVGARAREEGRYGYGSLVDLIVYSHEEGIAKPDPRIYATACSRLDVAPSDAVFLDDVPEFVAGARTAGLDAIEFHDTDQAIADLDAWLAGDPGT
jgi:putative hydrolase of the HAD superfamily